MKTIKLRKLSRPCMAGCFFMVSAAAFALDKNADEKSTSTGEVFTLIGQVVNVLSGDSLQVLMPNGELLLMELAGVKAPRKNKAFSEQSTLWLSDQLLERIVSADCEKIDGRLYCVVYPDNRDINRVSLYQGYSICDEAKSTVQNKAIYIFAEHHARSEKIGIWAAP